MFNDPPATRGTRPVAPAPARTISRDTRLLDIRSDLTSELRWFVDGPIPPEVTAWFTAGGTVGFVEPRCDRYRVDGLGDVGVKRRSGTMLELKRRLGSAQRIEIEPGFDAWLEIWQRWSPADQLVTLDCGTRWVDVDKRIVKRRFDVDGREIELTDENRAMDGVGCDAEIVAVDVDGRRAWGLAFAAFGRLEHHDDLVRAAWASVMNASTRPRELDLRNALTCGYPAWLTMVDVGAVRRLHVPA